MTLTITQIVAHETTERWIGARLLAVARAFKDHEGSASAAIKVGVLAGAFFYTAAFAGIGISGIGRTLFASAAEKDVYAKMAFMGNSGSWFLQIVASGGFCANFISRLVREGEFYRTITLIQKWLQHHTADLEEQVANDPALADSLYMETVRLLRKTNDAGLWRRNEFSIRLKALEIFHGSAKSLDLVHEASQLHCDHQMQPILQEVATELAKDSWLGQLKEGCRYIGKNGVVSSLKAATLGVVAPAALTASAALDVIGVIGLGQLIYGVREDMTEEGHISEWSFNAVEALSLAYLLVLWTFVYAGVFSSSKKVCNTALERLNDNPVQREHVAAIALKDLKKKACDAGIK